MDLSNHLVIYADGDAVEEFDDWDKACIRFDRLIEFWPAVELRTWSPEREDYLPIVTFQENPYFVMRNLRKDYRLANGEELST